MRLLEIGPGKNPAFLHVPGTLLQGADYEYFSVDANPEERDYLLKYQAENLGRFAGTIAVGDSAALAFDDQFFSHVAMRSVFGEYTMRPEHTASGLENTRYGLYEAFRVLQDNGEIFIAEENTPYAPATPVQIGGTLLHAGFDAITVYPCQDGQNPQWHEQRTKIWGMRERNGSRYVMGQPIDAEWGYLIHAVRPEGALTESFEGIVSDHAIWKVNNERGWGHPTNRPYDKRVTLHRSKRTLENGPGRHAEYARINIVHKDGEVDLKTHMEAVRENRAENLFFL